jgi:UDP-2,3-diacylglucosamine pyrophosphatase LpxH
LITQIETEKMVIISDLHLGNPFSGVKRKTIQFIEWASANGYDICINGDGFEITQVSLRRVANDVPEVLHSLKQAMEKGTNIYYVVGNHDIFFEHFLSDWGGFKLAPFLNVKSSSSRFRVEHGHLYDPFFIRFPRLYEFSTWMGGFALKVHPSLYKLWIKFEKFRSAFRVWRGKGIPGEPPGFRSAAIEIAQRGFDGIVFGHTHHKGNVDLEDGAKYLNPGSWMLSSTYIKIEKGRMSVAEFNN